MYKVGILSSSNKLEEEIVTLFKQVKVNVNLIQTEKIDEHLHSYDGIIIHEEKDSNFSRMCELFLVIKGKFSFYVWIFSEQVSSINRQIYLQLGADSIFGDTHFPEEIALHIKNALDRQKNFYQKSLEAQTNKPHYLHAKKKELDSCFKLNAKNLSLEIVEGKNQGVEISLTRLEYQLLNVLYSRPREAFTYKEIYECLWEENYQENPYRISNLVFHIRGKLMKATINPMIISTVRSKGYMLDI